MASNEMASPSFVMSLNNPPCARFLAGTPKADQHAMHDTRYRFQCASLDETAIAHLAALIAATAQPGDLIALDGDLGAGKTTLARALIRNLTGNPDEEIPSPTFTLVQTYETSRMSAAHFDLYRLADPDELIELGLDELLSSGIALIEWPQRGGDLLPAERLTIAIADAADADTNHRDVEISGTGLFAARAQRLEAILALLEKAGWSGPDVTIAYLQGDASARRYARIVRHATSGTAETAVLMDWPRQPDGPPIRDGLPYSRIAHLAEDVRPFVAIAEALTHNTIAAPRILAADLDHGLLLIEDFGDRVYGAELAAGADQKQLWQAALDVLVHLRSVRADQPLPITGAESESEAWTLPSYDADAMAIEVDLLADWLWPFATGSAMPADLRSNYTRLWGALIGELQTLPRGWTLRDFHSPNLIWRPGESGLARVGVIDFQDAMQGPMAYDVVSLFEDARVDVPPALETTLIEDYCRKASAIDATFDEQAFGFAYAALGAQRNTKILGIFARLAQRDGKPHYIAHMPRIWGYLGRCLQHPRLADIKAFYDAHIFTLSKPPTKPPRRGAET